MSERERDSVALLLTAAAVVAVCMAPVVLEWPRSWLVRIAVSVGVVVAVVVGARWSRAGAGEAFPAWFRRR